MRHRSWFHGHDTFIVKGKGCEDALSSAPHGAGRVMSRQQTRSNLTIDDLKSEMHGIEFNASKALIDEASKAYKYIDVVMADSKDLVEPVHELHQLVNVKGS